MRADETGAGGTTAGAHPPGSGQERPTASAARCRQAAPLSRRTIVASDNTDGDDAMFNHPRPQNFRPRAVLAAFGAASLLLVSAPGAMAAHEDEARPYPYSAQVETADVRGPSIRRFEVDPVARLVPGRVIDFRVRGTPGSEVWVQIEGASHAESLREIKPGVYQGSYTISTVDQIVPESRAIAQMRHNRRIDTASLNEPIVKGARWQPVVTAPLQIDRLSVQHTGERRVGSVVHVRLEGTAGGRAWAQLPGTGAPRIDLTEVRPGQYRASYTVQRRDRLDTDGALNAWLRVGERTTTASIADALDEKRGGGWRNRDLADCARCGTVVDIEVKQVDDNNNVAGTVAGGLIGAIVGSQIGGGDGRKVAGIAGAVGGALLGREIEKRNGRDEVYDVAVRLTDGHMETVRYEDPPPFRVGDRVRVEPDGLQIADTNERRERR
ncbi:MAG: glycine zipper 2TM domain-containing protein [Rubrivivax sp.]